MRRHTENDHLISLVPSHQNLPVGVIMATEKERMLSFLSEDSFLCFKAMFSFISMKLLAKR